MKAVKATAQNSDRAIYETMETVAEMMLEAGIISIDRIPGDAGLRVKTSDGREYSIGNSFPSLLDFDRRQQPYVVW